MRGKGKRKKKPRHPAEEQPDYKSLNCNQKGDGLFCNSITAFPLQLQPPAVSSTSKHDGEMMEESCVKTKSLHGKFQGKRQDFTQISMNHDILDYTLSTLHVSSGFVGMGLKTDVLKE